MSMEYELTRMHQAALIRQAEQRRRLHQAREEAAARAVTERPDATASEVHRNQPLRRLRRVLATEG